MSLLAASAHLISNKTFARNSATAVLLQLSRTNVYCGASLYTKCWDDQHGNSTVVAAFSPMDEVEEFDGEGIASHR